MRRKDAAKDRFKYFGYGLWIGWDERIFSIQSCAGAVIDFINWSEERELYHEWM